MVSNRKSMFGSEFKYVLVLTLLASAAYTLPQVQKGLADAQAVGILAQVYSASSPAPMSSPIVSCMSGYACVPLSSAPTISVSNSTVLSGSVVPMTFTAPQNTVAEKMFLSCPTGVAAYNSSNTNVCNIWQYVQMLTSQYVVTVKNNSSSAKSIIANFYAYPSTSPGNTVGVNTTITVQPTGGSVR